MENKLKAQLGVWIIALIFALLNFGACQTPNEPKKQENTNTQMNITNEQHLDSAIFASGCFWCVEAIFQRLDGVEKVISGYAGGETINPTYKEVCEGNTGHAEVCKIYFDPTKISFETLLSVFWQTHNPTTLNRQGEDVGTQYRSAIFYLNEKQQELATKYKKELSESGAFKDPIVTEITAYSNFYAAEDYHQTYYNNNSEQGYCRMVIAPKIEKFEKVFGDKLRMK